MAIEESSFPADWFRIAEKDLHRVEWALEDDDAEAAGFFLQQSVEKFLKAFLLSRGWKLRKIHDLDTLLDEAVAYSADLQEYRLLCQKITDYYLIERYPLTEPGPTSQEIRDSLALAKSFIEKLKRR